MLNEADTCTRYVVPKIREAGWDAGIHSFNEQQCVQITDGRIALAGGRPRRKPPKRADYLLKHTRDSMIAIAVAGPVDRGRYGLRRFRSFKPVAEVAIAKWIYFNLLGAKSLHFVGEVSPSIADRDRTPSGRRILKILVLISKNAQKEWSGQIFGKVKAAQQQSDGVSLRKTLMFTVQRRALKGKI